LTIRDYLEKSRVTLRTGFEPAHWCNPAKGFVFEKAKLRFGNLLDSDTQPTTWLDELLSGGITLPHTPSEHPNPLTILLTGPPGTGKTLFALQLCHSWGGGVQLQVPGEKSAHSIPALKSWYVTTEAHPPWITDNLDSLGWSNLDRIATKPNPEVGERARLLIESTRDLERLRELAQPGAHDESTFFKWIHLLQEERGHQHDVIVVDSLNTIPSAKDKTQLYDSFASLARSRCLILIVILDSAPDDSGHHHWEFLSDVVMRFDWRRQHGDYTVRTLEVVKTRYQKHVWGRQHQIKILSDVSSLGADKPTTDQDTGFQRLRAHPYLPCGGVTVYPSIHWVLSRYKRNIPTTTTDYLTSSIPHLNHALGKTSPGFPKGRCTALVGARGGHKSHVGYSQVLTDILVNDQKALVVSLRDNENTTKTKMTEVLAEVKSASQSRTGGIHGTIKSLTSVDEMLEEGLLEIDYYHPGYITPEEFFNRLLLSINRLRGTGRSTNVTLFFNSLDQLWSRFPLCSEESVFVPGLINTLNAEGVTSIFATRPDRDGRQEHSALLSMADLILAFKRKKTSRRGYLKAFERTYNNALAASTPVKGKTLAIELTVERFGAGRSAGARGYLELVTKGSLTHAITQQEGLLLAPL